MTLTEILNVIKCGADSVIGTGSKGCKAALERVSSIWLLPRGTELDGTRTLNDEYANELKAEGKLIVLKGIQSWTDNTPDDVTEDLEGGTKLFVRGGKYEFEASFINGMFFNSALNSLNSQGNYDAIFVDVAGNILGTKSKNDSLKGFSLGYLRAKKLTWGTDSASQREGVMIQLTERSEVDKNWYFIDGNQLGDFSPASVDGVNEVDVNLSVPSAGTTIIAKMKLKADGHEFIGVPIGDVLVTVNGFPSNPTSVTESAGGTYTYTVASISATDVVSIKLFDNSNNRSGIEIDGEVYKSNTDSETTI